MKRLVIFASGRGSNAEAIADFFEREGGAELALIVSNKPQAGVLEFARRKGIPTLLTNRPAMSEAAFIETLRRYRPHLIVLAGFLLRIPAEVVTAFSNRIVNIHPALLPRWGGQGMWGHHVHEAVLGSGELQSGITIHLVDEEYDHGAMLVQASCPVLPGDNADSLAARIQKLEHFYYPRAIQFLLAQMEE